MEADDIQLVRRNGAQRGDRMYWDVAVTLGERTEVFPAYATRTLCSGEPEAKDIAAWMRRKVSGLDGYLDLFEQLRDRAPLPLYPDPAS
jgi:hypothetical protein